MYWVYAVDTRFGLSSTVFVMRDISSTVILFASRDNLSKGGGIAIWGETAGELDSAASLVRFHFEKRVQERCVVGAG